MNLQGWHLDASPWPEQVSVVGLGPSLLAAGHSWHHETVMEEKEDPAAAREKKVVLGGLEVERLLREWQE